MSAQIPIEPAAAITETPPVAAADAGGDSFVP